MSDLPILIRPGDSGDTNYVRSSWLRSHADSALARCLGRSAYMTGHHDVIDALLERATLRVACSVTHRATIVGWACVEPADVVHYVFVREEFRRYGVARRLLADVTGERVTYSHRTDVCKQLPIPEGWHYDFYRALKKEAA